MSLFHILGSQNLCLELTYNFALNYFSLIYHLIDTFKAWVFENLFFKKTGSGKHCYTTVVVSYIMLYWLISFFSKTNKLR